MPVLHIFDQRRLSVFWQVGVAVAQALDADGPNSVSGEPDNPSKIFSWFRVLPRV